jgi:hypothetical protein
VFEQKPIVDRVTVEGWVRKPVIGPSSIRSNPDQTWSKSRANEEQKVLRRGLQA